MLPIFLDIEASSLSNRSYPIEVAWSSHLGEIESHMINPYGYSDIYTDWDPAAQAIHGLSRNYLSNHGKHPLAIAKRINEVLREKEVYSDAAEYDAFWLDRLFDAVSLKREFKLLEVDLLLQDYLPVEYFLYDPKHKNFYIQVIKEKARNQCGKPAHRASNDVAYLIELFNLSCEIGKNLQ